MPIVAEIGAMRCADFAELEKLSIAESAFIEVLGTVVFLGVD